MLQAEGKRQQSVTRTCLFLPHVSHCLARLLGTVSMSGATGGKRVGIEGGAGQKPSRKPTGIWEHLRKTPQPPRLFSPPQAGPSWREEERPRLTLLTMLRTLLVGDKGPLTAPLQPHSTSETDFRSKGQLALRLWDTPSPLVRQHGAWHPPSSSSGCFSKACRGVQRGPGWPRASEGRSGTCEAGSVCLALSVPGSLRTRGKTKENPPNSAPGDWSENKECQCLTHFHLWHPCSPSPSGSDH